MPEWTDPAVAEIVSEASISYLAVDTGRGPHLTPQLFAMTGGRLWLVTPERSLKIRSIRARPATALVIPGPDGRSAVVARGEATVVDILSPIEAAGSPVEAVLAAPAMAAYAAGNPREMLSLARDAVMGRLGSLADRRALISFNPTVIETLRAPAGVASVLGWMGEDGPIAVPAAWDEAEGIARLSDAAAGLLEGAKAPACVTLDESQGPGPAAKSGRMLRGTGRVTGAGVALDVERVTTWHGDKVATSTPTS